MKLYEIYEGYVRFTNVRNVAVKILNIHKQINGHDDGGNQEQAALHNRIVAFENAIDHPLADARP